MTPWQPSTVVSEEVIDPAAVSALSALLDTGTPAPKAGDPLPPLWHWVALARWPVSTLIGPDGHPARGDFLPPVELPRRMFAGGTVERHGVIHVGATVRREARVASVTPKSGRSGPLVIVEVEIRLFADGDAPAVVERQQLLYRDADAEPRASALPRAVEPVGAPLRRSGRWDWELRTDPTVLMRFSAATANAHRIHYDWPYATAVEGYPNLVVHGPLITLALAEVIRLERPGTSPARLRHRNLAPLFCADPARVRRRNEPGDGVTLELAAADASPGIVHAVLTADFPSPGKRFHA
ncbi:MaoC family dehydratase N-terminal domain-containing protein [Nocardia sp. NPDC057668]|uniref:FAS1-like dehydratase domain-containing protein n=1 Tax=Nocardia sp. NPDC057668 TaxID=3346202 RepID=UPI00366FB685